MRLRPLHALVAIAFALVVAGCAAAPDETGSVPATAGLAPADAIAFVTLVTDESSEQWENADRLLGLFPDARSELVDSIRTELAQEDLSWTDDVAPALGDELVVVVTADRKPVVLLQPESDERLQALIAKSDEPLAKGTVDDWTVLAETQADIDSYRAALGRGTLEGVRSFETAMTGLPAEALVRGWVDLKALSSELTSVLAQPVRGDLGVDWLAAALAAEEDGVHLSLGVRTPDDNGSSYDPELFDRVPADAVAALSFGGTQGVLDRVEGTVDVGGISKVLQETVGVSLDGLLDALSGEGLLYVRKGGSEVPEVTLVLAPPDTDKAFDTVDRVVRKLARQSGEEVRTRTESGRAISELTVEGFTLAYEKLDDGMVIVTTGPGGIADFLGDGPKLVDSDAFQAASERVDLGERTRGFAYVDIDGLIPLIESIAGPEALPAEARNVLQTIDSFILEGSGDGPTTQLDGFVRVTR
jgi:hypothetical protein